VPSRRASRTAINLDASVAWSCQSRLVPEWEPDKSIIAPDWLREGARVRHTTFGIGTVGASAMHTADGSEEWV
jgi:hypothetical protein